MNTKIVWIVAIIVILAAGAWYALSAKRAAAPAGDPFSTTTQPVVTMPEKAQMEEDGGPAFTVITLTDTGFSPSTVTVARGETVRFINESSRSMWVGADVHPTHTEYDGTSTREHCANDANTTGSFDQCTAVEKGDFWDYTFGRSGTFGYHNHVGASNTGAVVVK